jgi:hypothetical protein
VSEWGEEQELERRAKKTEASPWNASQPESPALLLFTRQKLFKNKNNMQDKQHINLHSASAFASSPPPTPFCVSCF